MSLSRSPGIKPVIFGCAGLSLTPQERAFFSQVRPFGFILFQRNCAAPDQVRALVDSLRTCVADANVPVFIDQEGGRVARLKPPHWPKLPPLRPIGALYEQDPAKGLEAMELHAAIAARTLTELGIDGNCAPVLDLAIEGASSAIGDRALSARPATVSALGRVAVETFLRHGVMPVIKHMPGHGRVQVDPHHALPFVDTGIDLLRQEDFLPFQALADAPVAMNCHVVFRAVDPDRPVSLSPLAHRAILRGELGFKGLLFSDDLAMKALSGALPDLAVKALTAGADIVLYCEGALPEMWAIAARLPALSPEAQGRWAQAQQRRRQAMQEAQASSLPVAEMGTAFLTTACERLATLLDGFYV